MFFLIFNNLINVESLWMGDYILAYPATIYFPTMQFNNDLMQFLIMV
jgi:hypothetical protein